MAQDIDQIAASHGITIPSFDTRDPQLGSDLYVVKSQAIRLVDTFERELRELSATTNSVVAVGSASGTACAVGVVADPYHIQPVHTFQILGDQLHDFDGSRGTLPPKRLLQTPLNLAMLQPGDILRDNPLNEPLTGFGEATDCLNKELCGLAFIDQFNLADQYWTLSATFAEIGNISEPALGAELDRIVNEATPKMTPGDWAPWLDDPPASPPAGGHRRAVALLPDEYELVQGQMDNMIRPVHLDIDGRIGVVVLHPIDQVWVDDALRRGGLRWLHDTIVAGDNPIAQVHANMASRAGRSDPVAAFEDWVDAHVPLDIDLDSRTDNQNGRAAASSAGANAQANGDTDRPSQLFDRQE